MFEISRDTMISEILTNAPEAMPVFQNIGMHCLGCAMASGETLEQALWTTFACHRGFRRSRTLCRRAPVLRISARITDICRSGCCKMELPKQRLRRTFTQDRSQMRASLHTLTT